MIPAKTIKRSIEDCRVVVIGGANLDIFGFPQQKLILHDSNPGIVKTSPGGVGRNIAENLARLGVETALLTAMGNDVNGQMLLEGCRNTGMDVSRVLRISDMPTSVYLAVMDESGDMHVGINQMDIVSQITPQYIDSCADVIEASDLIVLDANLSAETILHIAEKYTHKPIFADPVSTAKSVRFKQVLACIHTVKPNALQAGTLTGVDTGNMNGLKESAEKLLVNGVKRVFITLGSQGVYCTGGGQGFLFHHPPVSMVNATGAGDAFTAGLAYAHLNGMGMRETAAFASALAALTVQCEQPIDPDLNVDKVLEEYNKVLKEGCFE